MRFLHFMTGCTFSLFFFICIVLTRDIQANHGPGAGGGTVSTIPAITLKSGTFSFGMNAQVSELETISESKLLKKGLKGGSFDAVDRTFLYSMSIGYGITDDFSLGLSLGWFESINFREAELEDDEVEIFHANPDGLTDLWLTGTYRFYRGPSGHYAVFLGFKFPTGNVDKKNNEGEKLEPVDQPGSGSYDFTTGISYSRWITKNWTLDTNFQYILRTEGARDFKIGDRTVWNIATAYQVTPRNTYPNFKPVGQINVWYLFRDEQNGRREENSGGTTIFLSPGMYVGITPDFGVNTSVNVPVFQNLLGNQQETNFKASVGFHYNF